MHEDALLRDLRRKLEEIARTGPIDRITCVRLWVGALAHTNAASLHRRWAETVVGTAAEGSRLEVESSTDVGDPRANGIVLVAVDAADGGAGPSGYLLREPPHSPHRPPEE